MKDKDFLLEYLVFGVSAVSLKQVVPGYKTTWVRLNKNLDSCIIHTASAAIADTEDSGVTHPT